MEKKKNIIHITGIDSFSINKETERFLSAFRQKHDANSIDFYRIDEVRDWKVIIQNTQTLGLFVEKRLFVFSGNMKKQISKAGEISQKEEKKVSEMEDSLLYLCEHIDDSTFIIFSDVQMESNSKLGTWLRNNADVRKYSDIWNQDQWHNRYPHLELQDIHKIVSKYKLGLIEGENDGVIASLMGQTFEKLSLLKESRPLQEEDFEKSTFLEATGEMFSFTDAIMGIERKKALKQLHSILERGSIDKFIPNCIGALRKSVYTKYYKKCGLSLAEISKIIPGHPFPLQKAFQSKISYEDLYCFYHELLSLNIVSRSGFGKKDSELGRIFSIELAIMRLKK